MDDIGIKLFKKLKEFYNDKDFVVGVMTNADNPDDWNTILDYIENGEDVTVENVILLSLELCNNRKDT